MRLVCYTGATYRVSLDVPCNLRIPNDFISEFMMVNFIKGTVILLLIAWITTCIEAQASLQINVRIASGSGDGTSYGRVEVSKGGSAWGTVCDKGWDDNEARVVCKQLGYLWGRGYTNSKYGQGTGNIYLDTVICKGDEASLNSCIYNQWGTHTCSHSNEASVQCFNTTVFVPSAVDGVYGPVLVWHLDQWMPVCESGWSDKQAQVVCKQLNFTTGYGFCCSTFTTWIQSIVTYSKALTVGTCTTGATKIEDCRSVVLTNACGYRHQASVLCLNQTKDTDAFKVRLTANGLPNNISGRVEVRYKGKWGTICTKNATDEIAEVACTQMGYAGGWVLGARPGVSDLMTWMGNVSCDGTEASLQECQSSGLGNFGFCDHDSDVHVLCYEDAYSNAECRMTVLGTEYAGKQNTTATGLTCQRWDSQYPHVHVSNQSLHFPENDLADAANYCRNPGAWSGGLWCYTTSRTVTWNKCNVPLCKSDQCRHTTKGTHYNGTMSAVGNIPCQRWDSQTPHRNSMSQLTTFIDGNATLAKNYCRNPDSDPRGPWCYTTVSTPVYQYCNISYCSFHEKCRRTPLGREYTGTISKTKNGYPCLPWSRFRSKLLVTQFPEHSTTDAKNYCRNPKNRPKGPWCYVSLNNRIYYDYCNIPYCNSIKVRLMGGKERSHGGRVEIEYDGKWGTICDRDWDDRAARVVCRQLGYADGLANRTTYTDKASGQVWLDRLNCTGNERSIEKCASKGRWNVTDAACTGHSRDAGVLCTIDVKLRLGYMMPNKAIGMVLLYNNSVWSKQCGNTWDDNASKVVCRQLGYNYSKTLCCSTYGTAIHSVALYHPQCSGNETKIHECKFIPRTCQSHETNYASVMCSKTSFRALDIGLTGAVTAAANFSGNVVAMYSGVTGSICRNGWGNEEATVVCKGLNYKAGVVLQHRLDKTVDILASDFSCKGTEEHILDCKYSNTSSCPTPFRYSKQAGVLCYNKIGLAFRIVEQSPGAGRVEVQYDGVWGTVCDSLWSSNDAKVFCRQNGYKDGIAVSGSRMGRGTGPVYLTGLSCMGTESSILQCINFGWRRVYASCLNHTRDAGVQCFRNVRLYRSVVNSTTKATMGAVMVRKSGLWGRVCSSGFDDNDALVVCRELHYTHGKSLGPGAFRGIYTRIWMTDTQCLGNEDSILNCTHDASNPYACRYNYSDYATVLCYSGPTQPKFKLATTTVLPGVEYFRHVFFNVLGMKTRVCKTAWTDVTSNVTCKQLGYTGGVAMLTYSYSSTPLLTPKFNCNSQHTKIEECRTDYKSDVRCTSTSDQAGVLCYNKSPGVQFRISGGRSRNIGRAEIGYEGKWGTICTGGYMYSSSLSRMAQVHCRSMGYPSGKVSYTFITAASSATPIYLRLVSCTGNEASLLQCRHYGWMGRNTSCNHRWDLKVSCDADVRIGYDNSKSFGPLYIRYSTGTYTSYYLICDNTFTDREANVACRNLGYPGGRAICCSAFGRTPGLIRVKDVKCLEEGRDVRKCAHTIIGSNNQCPNRTYASVACFDEPPSTAMSISLPNATSPIEGTVSARVTVTYLGIPGNICPSTWTDKEAMVVCRQLGYAGGQVYRHYPPATGPFWLGNVSCTGYENSLLDCKVSGIGGGVRCAEKRYVWGTYLTSGGVLCWPAKTAPPKYSLVDGTKRSGRIEIDFNGTKGAICQYSFYSNEASAVCRGLGFLGGTQDYGYFGYNYTGSAFVQSLKCGANASSVAECSHSSWRNSMMLGSTRTCQAVGVTCFGYVRLVLGPTNYFGMVQLYKGSLWYNMCDEGFDDMAARVVCKELGFTDGKKVCCSTFRKGAYTSNQVLNKIKCGGSESSLEKCQSTSAHCSSGHYASVYCLNNTVDVTKPTKFYLSNDYNLQYTGSVNVMYKGVLGRVCSQGWTDREANVFCKQLNYKGGVAFTQSLINKMPVMISNVTCGGASKTLEDCTFDDVITSENGGCDRFSPTAGVLCAQTDTSIGYRLADGGDSYGRAEIKYDGVWGTICTGAWSLYDATTFCRSMGKGFVGGTRKYQSIGNAVGSPVWFTSTYCNGNESSPLQCQSSGWLQVPSYCRTHRYDAAVQCYGTVRLDRSSYGRVMVYTENKWSSVCEQDWDQKETDVVCKSLGYSVGYTLCCGAFGYNYRLARLTGFQCTGTESNLLACTHRKATDTEGRACTRLSYASVACSNWTSTDYEDIKLSSYNSNTGTVLIKFNNIYGRICPDGWDNNAARVVCRELGFRDGTPYTHYENTYYGSYRPYWTSNVKCNGHERSLKLCSKTDYGKVTSCRTQHSAGVLCFRNSGITVRMTGSDNPKTGTVEVMVDGTWGTVCNSYFDDRDAKVLCTSMNFADGIAIRQTPYRRSGEASTVWYNRLSCFGNESRIDECPHSSWTKTTSYSCRYHRNDVAVNCYGHVRLINKITGPKPLKATSGAVQVFTSNGSSSSANLTWLPVCDEGFTDSSARRVCQELGFIDGHAVCCSAYGNQFGNITNNAAVSLQDCENSVMSVKDCVKVAPLCKNATYASVMCLTDQTIQDDGTHKFSLEETSKGDGRILVNVYSTTGRVCSVGWDDTDAMVYCKSKGYQSGIAYFHSKVGSKFQMRQNMPYLVSDVDCKGDEGSLDNCTFNNATALNRNCTEGHDAGVICFNEGGISYRRKAPPNNQPANAGRVEIMVGAEWGTVCDSMWDKFDAAVFCRSLGENFNDGDPTFRSNFGSGTGPIWLSHLQCLGTEVSLHQCAHRGFNTSVDAGNGFKNWDVCKTHNTDAGVVCYKKVRLNQLYKRIRRHVHYGTVEVYDEKKTAWAGVCFDDAFNITAAKIVCSELGYVDGRAVPRTSFGNVTGGIVGYKMSCSGKEKSFAECKKSASSCQTGQYAGVYCSNETITDTGFKLAFAKDNYKSVVHGAIEVTLNGVTGRVCGNNWGKTESTIACKGLGFTGGVPIVHLALSMQPNVMSNVSCTPGITTLKSCSYTPWGDNYACSAKSFEAGVLCYKKNFEIRLANGDTGPNPSFGRIDIKYDDVWGTICDKNWKNSNARVICREKGFVDGIAKKNSHFGAGRGMVWVEMFYCRGTEKSLMQCLNSGFNSTSRNNYFCRNHQHDASVICYNEMIEVDKVRLVEGNRTAGRLEVYATGIKKWGTVCNDLFNDNAANVVCRMLGFAGGRPSRAYPPGSGEVLLDNVVCKGDEKSIKECRTNDIGTHNCLHDEDIGVICEETSPSTTTTTIKPVKPTVTPKTKPTKPPPPTKALPPVVGPDKQTGPGTKKSGILAAFIVPIVITIVVFAAIAGFIIYKIRSGKAAAASAANDTSPSGRECPMQITNVLYDMALEDRPHSQEIPTNFENPMYDNANSNKPDVAIVDDGASGIYASLDTPPISVRSNDGEPSPRHKKKKRGKSGDKDDLVDNIHLDVPGSDEGSNV